MKFSLIVLSCFDLMKRSNTSDEHDGLVITDLQRGWQL
jgi:hypothetical protein